MGGKKQTAKVTVQIKWETSKREGDGTSGSYGMGLGNNVGIRVVWEGEMGQELNAAVAMGKRLGGGRWEVEEMGRKKQMANL
jgi:hypothetical protein